MIELTNWMFAQSIPIQKIDGNLWAAASGELIPNVQLICGISSVITRRASSNFVQRIVSRKLSHMNDPFSASEKSTGFIYAFMKASQGIYPRPISIEQLESLAILIRQFVCR